MNAKPLLFVASALLHAFMVNGFSSCPSWWIALLRGDLMRIGIDLGGTKIAAIALDDDGRTMWESRIATPRDDYAGTIEAVAGLVAAAEHATGTTGTVGVAIPGAVSPATGLIKNANSTWLNGRRLPEDLAARLQRPVRLANDANCLGVSEATDGAAAQARVVFAVILGTGTGGALVVDQQPITGANAIAGEWGHNPLPWPRAGEWPGPPCYCGRTGCIETFLSGPGLAADYVRRGGSAIAAAQVVARAAANDPIATASLGAWIDRAARALASIVNVIDPDVIVVGGGLSRIDRLYTDVPAQWSAWIFSDRVDTALVPARYGDASGVRGAAWLWERPAARTAAAGMLL
jgi:fructokinase